MTTTEENLKSFLGSDDIKAAAPGGCHYNNVPQGKARPYIFFQQAGADDDMAMADSAGTPTRPRYAVEFWADRPSDAVSLKNLVQARLHKHRGTFGDTTVKGIFAKDVDDDYVANGAGEDAGLHGAALFAEVVL